MTGLLKTGFTVFYLIFGRKVQLIVFSYLSGGLILALWNGLNLFSATGIHPWPHTGGGVPQAGPQECVLYKIPQERAWTS